jgi:hypothetical protein
MGFQSLQEAAYDISGQARHNVSQDEEIVVKIRFFFFGQSVFQVLDTIQSSVSQDFMLTHLIIIEW